MTERARRLAVATLLTAALVPGSAFARWYQVDVVVFRHLEGLEAGGEQWPELMELPEFGRAVELITELPEMSDEPLDLTPAGQGATPLAFEALEREDRRLVGVERRLRSSGEYEPLVAAAWRQPSFGVSRARWVYVSDAPARIAPPPVAPAVETEAGEPPGGAATLPPLRGPRVEGVVRIKVSRLLHVDVDFLYYEDGTPVRLKETRKLKLREIHYFDHPLFGIVLQVSPFALPTPGGADEALQGDDTALAP